jgi:hypothetical protein
MGALKFGQRTFIWLGVKKFHNSVHRSSHGNIVATFIDRTLPNNFGHLFWTLYRFLIYLRAAMNQTGTAYFTTDVSEILCTVAVILVQTPKIKFILLCHWPCLPKVFFKTHCVFDMKNCFSSYLTPQYMASFFVIRYGRIILGCLAFSDVCFKFQASYIIAFGVTY